MIGTIKRYKKRNKEFVAALGEFVYNFELLVLGIKKVIIETLKRNGLKNETLVEILIHDSTGAPLIKYLQAALQESFKLQAESDIVLLKLLKNKLADANELRNDIVHSGWILGYGVEKNDPDLAIGIRNKVHKDGLASAGYTFEVKHFHEASKHIETLEKVVRKICKNIEKKKKIFTGVNSQMLTEVNLKPETH